MTIRSSTEMRLLDAAEELFFTKGIAATPVDEVITRAGVSAATLYRGYPTKEALVAAALARRHEAWLREWDAAIAARSTPRAKLLAVFDALDSFRERPSGSRWCAFLGSAAEYASPPPELQRAVTADTESLRARLRAGAVPVVGSPRAWKLADQLLLVVTGDLAMHLRDPAHTARTAKAIAASLVAAALPAE